MILEAMGLFLESRGFIVRISGIVVIFGAHRLRKSSPILKQIWTSCQRFAVLYFCVFSSACFSDFLWFWVPGDSILALILKLFWESRTFKKPLKLCNRDEFQRFGPFQIQSFFKSCLRVRFDSVFFRFLGFLAVLRLPFWDLLELIVVKKTGMKKNTKNYKKGVREEQGADGNGGGGVRLTSGLLWHLLIFMKNIRKPKQNYSFS